jgi:hypothetical protein
MLAGDVTACATKRNWHGLAFSVFFLMQRRAIAMLLELAQPN